MSQMTFCFIPLAQNYHALIAGMTNVRGGRGIVHCMLSKNIYIQRIKLCQNKYTWTQSTQRKSE